MEKHLEKKGLRFPAISYFPRIFKTKAQIVLTVLLPFSPTYLCVCAVCHLPVRSLSVCPTPSLMQNLVLLRALSVRLHNTESIRRECRVC